MSSAESQRIRATFVNDAASIHIPLEVQRRDWEEAASRTPLLSGITLEVITADGVPCEWVRSTDTAADKVMMWLHGGGFSTGSCVTHRDMASRLSLASGIPVLTVDYRLVPEHPFPAGIEDAVTVYRWLLKTRYEPQNIVIGGDSSGGGLTASALVMLRDAGDPMPAGAVLISPMADMALVGESFNTRAGIDPLISQVGLKTAADLYAADNDPTDPLLSPVYADLHGFPPLLIQVGDHELLLSDSTRLADHARAANVPVEIQVWPDMWHVFQGWAAELPEAREAIERIGKWMRGIIGGHKQSQ